MATDFSSSPAKEAGYPERTGLNPARWVLDRLLPTLVAGQLRLVLPNGEMVLRRAAAPGPVAEMSVRRWRGLGRILLGGETGFAESYLDGDWSTTDLPGLLDFFLTNEAAFAPRSRNTRLTDARNRLTHRLRQNSRRGSRRNIAAHYDLGNAFYALWLDGGMNYSSGIYTGNESLEAAQGAKLDRIIALLDLAGGESVLEIGCGWGALAERIVRDHDAAVRGITLSTEQLRYAKARVADCAGPGRADLRLQDYRDVDGRYDRIASIEMLEAVGERYWPGYFAKLRASLKPGGVAVIQSITIDESRFAAYRDRPDFIQRYIFPGGMLPTIPRIAAEAERAGLTLVHREDFGASYARTLQDWRGRFARSWHDLAPLGFDERFRRMWDYYLAYCEAGFRRGAVNVSIFKIRG